MREAVILEPSAEWLETQPDVRSMEIGHGRDADVADGSAATRLPPVSLGRGLVFGLVVVAALTTLVCWLGTQAHDSARKQDLRIRFLAAGREGVMRLTTITDSDVEAKVKQILDSSTGAFHEDFQQRSASFIDTVQRSQSKTVGTVVEAGLETVLDDRAEVLVAVSVKTSLAGSEAPPRLWRMRIGLQKAGREIKVSNVEFVP